MHAATAAAATRILTCKHAHSISQSDGLQELFSRVCKRWRRLCFCAPELWETLLLSTHEYALSFGEGQPTPWLQRKRWLLQVRS